MVKQLKVRNIGPANMGGRTVDFAVPENNTSVIYAAVGPSGLWKSEDSGVNWAPSFHKEATVSVGAVAVSQSHTDIVWVGSGEATARNSVAPGDGVYKSEDAGKTWKNMGLAETRFISRIVIDPVNPDIVYVAAQGHLWGPERRPRRLPDARRRENLEKGPLCQSRDRRLRSGHRPLELQDPLRRDVGIPPLAVLFPERRTGKRGL